MGTAQRALRAGFIAAKPRSRFLGAFLLAASYFIIAAAAFNGFYSKWEFRDDDAKFSLVAMLDGTAERPYIYRQLVPSLANAINSALPVSLKSRLEASLYTKTGGLKSGINSPAAKEVTHVLRYHLVYYFTFLTVVLALFAMREVCLLQGFAAIPATVAPAILMLCVPFIQSVGGYLYDFPEILFMATAFLLISKRTYWPLIPLTALATANKESFLFYTLTLYPLLRQHLQRTEALALNGALVLVAGLTYLAIRTAYTGNPGLPVHIHAPEILAYYLNPLNLFGRDTTYGLRVFQAYSFVTLILVGVIALRGWRLQSEAVRKHILFAAAINLPLFLLFCVPGELRNLSLMYMGFLLLICSNLASSDAPAQKPSSGPAPEDRSTALGAGE